MFAVGSRRVPMRRLADCSCRHASKTPRATLKPAEALPGPRSWPILGNTLEVVRHLSKPLDECIWHKWYLQFGPIYKFKGFGGQLQVVVSDAAGAATLMRADGKYPTKGFEENLAWVYERNNFPSSMFSAIGPDWRRIRSAAAKQVMPRRVANFIPVLCEISDVFLDHLMSTDQGNVADASPELIHWAFQGMAYFVFGERVKNFKGDDQDFCEFEKAAQEQITAAGDLMFVPPLYKICPTKPYRRFVRSFTKVHAIGGDILKRKHEGLKDAVEKGVVDETKALSLLEQWVIEGKFTEDEAIAQCCDMLAAGVDTTSNTATFMLHELARKPQLQEKIHQEVTSVMEGKKYPSFEDLQKMTLVRNTVKETLRLYPAVNVLLRIIPEDIEVSGYHIPAKTPMMFNAYSISRSEEQFGDPHTFKPERWDRKTATHDVFTYLPFGFGQRDCYGRRLAELELYVLLTQVFRRFWLSTEQETVKKIQAFLLKPDEPLSLKFTQQ